MTSINNILETNVAIHPNMNQLVINEFNSERIQERIRMGMFYGEMFLDTLVPTDHARYLTTRLENSVIQILSIREDFETLKVQFKFLDTEYANTVKQSYIKNPQYYTLRTRALANYERNTLFLITFDLMILNVSGIVGNENDMIEKLKDESKPLQVGFSMRAMAAIGDPPPKDFIKIRGMNADLSTSMYLNSYDNAFRAMGGTERAYQKEND